MTTDSPDFRDPAGPSFPTPPRSKTLLHFLLVFGGIWTLVVMIFNIVLIADITRGRAAAGFPSAPGTIASADVESHMSSGKDAQRMYSAQVQYIYQVNGTTYTGNRIRHGGMSSSDSSQAHADVARYTPGSAVTVRYNPANPTDAVLETGVSGDTRFMAIFLTPFNAVMLATWAMFFHTLRGRNGRPEVTPDFVTRIRLSTVPPSLWGFGAILVASFPLLFIFAFLANGSATPRQLAVHQSVVLGAGIAAYIWQKRKVLAGDYDLLIDASRRCITLPRARLKQDSLLREVPFAKLTAIEIRDSTTTRVGNEPVKDVFINCASPGPGPVRLRAFTDRADAESFAQSLRAQTGIAPPPIPTS